MGQTTDFVGHIDIRPPLDPDQAERFASLPVTTPVAGEPELRRGWVCCRNGCCLTFCGDALDDPLESLRRLFTRLRTDGASHTLSGMVVGARRDTGELVAIRASASRVTERILHPGSAQPHVGRRPGRRGRARPGPAGQVIDLAARRARG